MEKHILFMLDPWIEDNNRGPFYCPDCGIVEGFLSYSPDIRNKIDIRSVAYERPRQEVADYLGKENQGCPVLVIPEGVQAPEGSKKSFSTGRRFMDDPLLICNYLGKLFDGVMPHP